MTVDSVDSVALKEKHPYEHCQEIKWGKEEKFGCIM